MNFTAHNTRYLINNYYNRRNKNTKENSDNQNSINQKILDTIIDDDDEQFTEIISQSSDTGNYNKTFKMTNYKFPLILSSEPTYASLCAYFSAEKCLDALSMLASAGLESSEIKQPDNFGRNPIHFACAGGSLSIIRKLDQAHFSLNEKDSEECLPSHYAAMAGNLDIFKYLWMKGADLISASNQYNKMTPLHVASLYGNLNIVKFICETVVGEDETNTNDDQKQLKLMNFAGFHNRYCKFSTPLHLACEGGHEDILRYLLTKKELIDVQLESLDRSSRTPLLVACKNGSLGCVKALIEYDRNLLKGKKNRKHVPLIDAAGNGYLDIVSFLLKQKEIAVDQINSQKLDAIMTAVRNDRLNVVKCLVDNGALKKYNDSKIGELFLSACGSNDINMVKYIDHVADIPYFTKSNNRVAKWTRVGSLKMDENTEWGTQFMQQACMLENEEIVTFLLTKKVSFEGVDLSMVTSKKWTPFMDFLLKKGYDLSKNTNSSGVPSIVSTIKGGSLKNVKKMIDKGAYLDDKIITEHNCILSACQTAKRDLFDFLMSFNPVIKNGEVCVERCIYSYGSKNIETRLYMAEQLLKTGSVDVNKSYNDYNNENLISRAVCIKSVEFLDLFAKYNADFTKVPMRFDQMALTADIQIIKSLIKYGCTFNTLIEYSNPNYGFFMNSDDMKTPLMQSFYLSHNFDYNKEFPVMLVDYMSDDEVEEIKSGREDVIDKFIGINSYEGVLKVFKKCNSVVYPKSMNKREFIDWIDGSGNQELIDFVANNK